MTKQQALKLFEEKKVRTVADPLGFPSAVMFIPGTRP